MMLDHCLRSSRSLFNEPRRKKKKPAAQYQCTETNEVVERSRSCTQILCRQMVGVDCFQLDHLPLSKVPRQIWSISVQARKREGENRVLQSLQTWTGRFRHYCSKHEIEPNEQFKEGNGFGPAFPWTT